MWVYLGKIIRWAVIFLLIGRDYSLSASYNTSGDLRRDVVDNSVKWEWGSKP